jgi:hypothetical protein
MNRRLLAAFLALGVLATSNAAFASRARLLVMGTGDAGAIVAPNGNGGSLYYDDGYNIFYNPAYVNDFKNWGIIEKSNGPNGTTAQGGMVTSIANFNLGLFFNRGDAIDATRTGYADRARMRPIDIMIGSDMGVKWGLGLTWGHSKQSSTDPVISENDMTLRAGVSVMDFEPFLAFKIASKDGTAVAANDPSYKDMTIGLRYKWGEWTPYAAWRTSKTTTNSVDSAKQTDIGIGIGRQAAIAEGARMVYSISAWRILPAIAKQTIIPINFAVEGDATSWLTLRGGLSYALVNQVNSASQTALSAADNTTARVGATFHLGKADVDFAVGAAGNTASTPEVGSTLDQQVAGIGPGLFSALSVAYRW